MPTRSRNTPNWSSECATLQHLSILSPNTRAPRTRFVSLFLRFFTNNSGWTLPALFATLRDLRDLAFDVSVLSWSKPGLIFSAGGRSSTRPESEERLYGGGR